MRHAYLLMVHKWDKTLELLLNLIDYPLNDIFIHIDKKSSHNFPYDKLNHAVTFSNLFTVPNVEIAWGGDSQIHAELSLLHFATENGQYARYHLLSGSDLPLESQKAIHCFFSEYSEKEFVDFYDRKFIDGKRVNYYHFFRNYYARSETFFKKVVRLVSKILLYLQIIFRIKRNQSVKFQKGSNWFSITDDFARYLVRHTKWIKTVFAYSDCADELFVQTLLINSEYRDRLAYLEFDNSIFGNRRLTLWDGKDCHTMTEYDRDTILNTEALFARKFDIEAFPITKDIVLERITR